MHVAAHLGIRTRNVRRNHLTLAASVEEEVDEDGLTSVEDFEEVVGLPVAVGHGEIDGLGEVGLLCAKTYSKEQEREEDVEFFHGMYHSRLNFMFVSDFGTTGLRDYGIILSRSLVVSQSRVN